MKKFFKYNVGAAIGALVLIIVLSVTVGVFRTVGSYKNRVEREFSSLSSGSAAEDLRSYETYAKKFSALAASLGADTSALDRALSEYAYTTPFGGVRAELDAVSGEADAVYAAVNAMKEADSDTVRSVVSYYYEMTSTVQRLQNNASYNNAAVKYNKAISTFPASVFAAGKKPAAVFDR